MGYLWRLLDKVICDKKSEKLKLLDRKKINGPMPVNDEGLLSFTSIGWLTPLVMKLCRDRKQEIREEDVWTCSEPESCDNNTERFEQMWIDELMTYGREKCSFTRLWLKFTSTRLLVVFLVLVVNALVTFFSSGYIIDVTTRYLEGSETSIPYAVVLVILGFVGQLLRVSSFSFMHSYGIQTGTRFRSAIIGIAYKKLMKLKRMNGRIASEAITIFGSDSLRVLLNTQVFVYILAIPVYLLIGIAYLYHLVGVWSFVALAIFFVLYFLQAMIINAVAFLRKRTLRWTDFRIQKLNEVFSNMKTIKMYAWEDSFKNSVRDIRKAESCPLMKVSIFNCICNTITPITPSLAAVATIAFFVSGGNGLTASLGFSIIATLYFMRTIVSFVPYAIRLFGETRISFERIKNFMLEEEFTPPSRGVLNPENAVELYETVFAWDACNINTDEETKGVNGQTTSSLMLKNINLTIKKGKHVGICGTVGCGKSSLLQALIGRMPLVTGHLAVGSAVAYAGQQAWIFNGTLRDNILFGRPDERDWYRKVLHACSLYPDLRILANGDQTEIGDRGTNLSGGQKQRVSLARAVYSKRDIYLLDDPLSAVDSQVGQHLFHTCIDEVLSDRTVLLVTHQLQYLKHCDEIYVMDQGEISEHGTHEALLAINGHYAKLMDQFDSTTVQSNTGTKGDENQEGDLESNNVNTSLLNETTTNDTCTNNNEKGILTERETSVSGSISKNAYISYVRAAGGKIVIVFVLLVYFLSLSSNTFTEWWLGIWIDQTAVQITSLSELNETGSNISVIENVTTFKVPMYSTRGTEEEHDQMDWYLTVYIYAAMAVIGLAILKATVAGIVVIKASVNIHNNAMERVMSAPMQYFDANPTGRILNRFSRDVDEADIFIPFMLDNFLQMSVSIAVSTASIAYNFPWLILPIVPIGLCVYIVLIISSIAILNFKRLENVVRSPLISHVTTSCSGLSTIVVYSQEGNLMKELKEYSDKTSVGIFLFESCLLWTGLRIDICGCVLVFITSIVVLFTKDTISPSLAALSLTMSIKVSSICQFWSRALNDVNARFTCIERLNEYENIDIEKETGSLQIDSPWPNRGEITFSNVEMKYRMDMDTVLKNISFDILPKQKVGIVGRTGAGKSSLTSALFRLTDLSGGYVFIDDVDISSVSRKMVRSNLSTIPQDPVMFAGTMRYNLDPFDQYTDAQMWAALDQVHMKEKMRLLGQTLDFFVEEGGENFSVGERQLICLARAILRQNKVLVLDEATASIDTSTDAMIQYAIRESFSDCTVLTIAHRLNTVLHCDVILVMEGGRVIEIGNPQALLKNTSSHFNNMIRAQTALPSDT